MRLAIPAGSRELARFGDWTLYAKADDGTHSFLWLQVRLMLPPGTPARRGAHRAYNLAWNPLELRFAKSGVSQDLERTHPALAAELDLYMSLTFDRAWLLSPEGGAVTEAEIAAELARLRGLRSAARHRRREQAPPQA